jgi:phosphoribosylformylglycinamidine synthase I
MTTLKIKALVLTGYGLNCDIETAYALELAGAVADRVHINAVIDGSVRLDDYKIMVFGGGFSWGDDHGAGVIQAVRMKHNVGDRLTRFVENDNLVIGICNGFQTIVNLGLLPGFDNNYQDRSVALTYNDCGNFRDDWVTLKMNPDSPCVFTKNLTTIELPVRHGEGKFVADEKTIRRLTDNRQVVCRYALPAGSVESTVSVADKRFPYNPNGSMLDIAGICDPTGRVFGLMPHPEAFNHFTNHPDWPSLKEKIKRGEMEAASFPVTGIRMFENAVGYFS